MAEYVVAADMVSSGPITLQPNIDTIVRFIENIGAVDILTDGIALAYFTTDGSVPDPSRNGGVNCYPLPPFPAADLNRATTNTARGDVVTLRSAGSPTVWVSKSDGKS